MKKTLDFCDLSNEINLKYCIIECLNILWKKDFFMSLLYILLLLAEIRAYKCKIFLGMGETG